MKLKKLVAMGMALVLSTVTMLPMAHATKVGGVAGAEGADTTVNLLPDPNGNAGQVTVSNTGGTQFLTQPGATQSLSGNSFQPSPPSDSQAVSSALSSQASSNQMINYEIKNAAGKVVGTFSAPANASPEQLASGLQSGLAGTNYAVSSQLAQEFGSVANFASKYSHGATSISSKGYFYEGSGAIQANARVAATSSASAAAAGTFSTATVLTGAGLVTIAVAAAGGGSSSTPSTPGSGGTGGTGTN